jgi:predicted transposase YdaD
MLRLEDSVIYRDIIEKGMKEGLEKGKEQGKIEVVMRLLKKKFKDVPKS